MLRFVFTDINDKEVVVSSPLTLTINMEENVPADDMTAVFPYFSCDELKDVKLKSDGTTVFTGIVDEQQTVCSSDTRYIKIVARSMAAKLIDNESVPISYTQPSVSVIEARHTKPYGVSVISDSDTTYFGTQTVLKGETNWKAVEDFSKNAYSKIPRVNELGQLDFSGVIKEQEVVFSNTGDGIRYTSFTESIKRCEEISKVRIKVTNSCGYNSVVENNNALSRGIQRERYLNAVLTDTPAVFADSMIKNGRRKAYFITLECSGQHLSAFGKKAKVQDSLCGDIDNLYVSSIRYQLSPKADVTVVTLKRKEV